jgi:hypothetical protein
MDSAATRLDSAVRALDIHDHACLIYETPEQQTAAIVPWVQEGLACGDRILYVADTRTVDRVRDVLSAAGIDVEKAEATGQLSIVTERDSYLRTGTFVPDETIEFLKDAEAKAVQDGYRIIRGCGEMAWMLNGDPGSERFFEYESKLNDFAATHRYSAL